MSLLGPLLGLVLAPLLLGGIHRVKAFFSGRSGAPWTQPYLDLLRLLRKGAVFSRTTTFVFRAGPLVALGATLAAFAVLPAGVPAAAPFEGDFLVLVGLLATARFATVLAALDTGSSFEGMGASREVQFASLCEPALFLALAAAARETGGLSLSTMLPAGAAAPSPSLVLVALALLVVFLVENARIPFDDPNTHLELTMVHEAMILDHGGPDLALLLYGAALKLWLLGAVLVSLVLPRTGTLLDLPLFVAGMFLLGALTGGIESSMARLRLVRVPQLLAGGCALAVVALAWAGR